MPGVNLATAYVQLVASAKGIQGSVAKELGAAGDAGGQEAGRRFGSALTGSLKSVTKVAGKALKFGMLGVGVAAGGLLAKGLSESFAQSDATTKFVQSLDFAGITKKQTDAATKITQKYADDTVYDLQTVQNTAAQLAANGVKDFTGLTKAAGNLNAVAGGNADTFRGVAMALTQTVGAGKLTTENWNQIADAIPGASGVLQAALKKNAAFTGNFRDAMAKGEITAAEFNKALMEVGNRPIAQKAATSTATFEGAIGNLMATITGGFADMLNKFKPQLTGFINLVTSGVGKAFKVVSGFLPVFIDNVSKIGPALKAGFNNEPIKNANLLQKAMQKVGDIAYWVYAAFASITSGIDLGSVVKQSVEFAKAVSPVGVVFAAIKPILPDVVQSIRKLAKAFAGSLAKVLPIVVDLSQTFASLLSKALAAALPIVTRALSAFASGLSAVGRFLSQHKTLVESVAVALVTFAAAVKVVRLGVAAWAAVTKVMAIAQAALNLVMDANPIALVVIAVAALAAGLVYAYKKSETFRKVVDAAFGAVKGTVEAVVGWFTDKFVPFFTETIPGAFQAVMDFVKSHWKLILGLITLPIGGAYLLVWKYWDKITGVFTGAWKSIKNIVSRGVGEVVGFIKGIWGKISWSLSTLKTNVIQKFKSIISWITGLPGKLKNAGAGLWNWITDGLRNTWLDVSRLWGQVISWVRGFPDSIGKAVSGLWSGMLSGLRSVAGSIIGIINKIIRGYNAIPVLPNIPEIPGLYKGGPAERGKPYIVGERGPELFVPNVSGQVIPNGQTEAALSRGRGDGPLIENYYAAPDDDPSRVTAAISWQLTPGAA